MPQSPLCHSMAGGPHTDSYVKHEVPGRLPGNDSIVLLQVGQGALQARRTSDGTKRRVSLGTSSERYKNVRGNVHIDLFPCILDRTRSKPAILAVPPKGVPAFQK